MKNICIGLFSVALILVGCGKKQENCISAERNEALQSIDSLGAILNWPEELDISGYAGPDLVPSPAGLAVAPTGEVFVGVDMIGSLGKDPGKGRIVRLVDCNNDGIFDSHTEFAQVDNPRGIISLGDQLFVLHTVFSEETGIASGMNLVVFEDKDQDGIADGPSRPLIENISSPKFLQSRGTDHATNGIRLGIDGWIYIAVGDFGFHGAIDREGTELTMLGGGIVRVRPDGTEMEVFAHGLRNVYDVAIDPFMNIFSRGNTNDGGGWNIRFSHLVQSGEYGYPVLFKHFTEEIIPSMIDLGGGSGTGALFMDNPSWPAQYNQVPMMADWGRSQLYIHRVTPESGSFDQEEEEFLKLPQITDLDIDGSGRLYLSAWDGAGYSGDSSKGFVVRAVPKNWEYEEFPSLTDASINKLKSLLKSENGVARLYAQQELISRSSRRSRNAALDIARDKSLHLAARVAGIFTYVQIAGEKGIDNLVKLTEEDEVREFALRALADRKPYAANAPLAPFIDGINDLSPRVQIASIIGLGRLGRKEAIPALLKVPVPPSFVTPPQGEEGPHAAPNPQIIPPHVAVQSLIALNAVESCVEAIGSESSTLALWALRYMHDPKAVDGLIQAYKASTSEELKSQILTTLGRLYQKEDQYDGSWWWGTRPDTHGPYYKPITWESSDKIKAFLLEEWEQADSEGRQFYADMNAKIRMGINQFGGSSELEVIDENLVDLDKIKNKKGQVGESSIEDVMLALAEIEGDPIKGKSLFTQQGCNACHSIDKGEAMKGPFMGQIGSIMSRQQIAESILKPNASISQGFASVLVTTKDDKSLMGFITAESAERIILRDITGQAHVIKMDDIAKRERLETSMMPPGLANSLSYEEFASLVTYLFQQKE